MKKGMAKWQMISLVLLIAGLMTVQVFAQAPPGQTNANDQQTRTDPLIPKAFGEDTTGPGANTAQFKTPTGGLKQDGRVTDLTFPVNDPGGTYPDGANPVELEWTLTINGLPTTEGGTVSYTPGSGSVSLPLKFGGKDGNKGENWAASSEVNLR